MSTKVTQNQNEAAPENKGGMTGQQLAENAEKVIFNCLINQLALSIIPKAIMEKKSEIKPETYYRLKASIRELIYMTEKDLPEIKAALEAM